MAQTEIKSELDRAVHEFVRRDFSPRFGKLEQRFGTEPQWRRLRELGAQLWLDSGNIEQITQVWTREFAALTTNNTLLNKEIQTGRYDDLILESAELLDRWPQLSEDERILEITFILNASHALRLVETFDAYVSVEEHTDLANDVDRAVGYARRYHAICPERFFVKIPFTPAGVLATRKLAAEGIAINHTLGFSARQNYLIARIAKPAFVNVFLGRLNSFVADNGLGDGSYIGEKATLASQLAIRRLREEKITGSRQIGASFREGSQVRDLAGIDVMTIPPKVAGEFLSMEMPVEELVDKTSKHYRAGINDESSRKTARLDTLWQIDDKLVACIERLEKENIGSFTPADLVDFFEGCGCGDVLVRSSDSQVKTSAAEGKIPKLDNWKEPLADKSIGLDSLMNLAGLNSFATDQEAMDRRVKEVLSKAHRKRSEAGE